MKISLIVVHGVGDPLPGNALEKLIEGLTAHQWSVVDPICIEHRREDAHPDAPTDASRTKEVMFPVARATLSSADADCTLRMREVYWGDLSRPKSSLFGLLSALFDLIFGLRYIVTAAALQLHGIGHWAAQLARAALWWARGPMFALNIIAAAVCLTYAALLSVRWPFPGEPLLSAPLGAVLFGSIGVAGAGWFVSKRAEQLQWSPATGDAMRWLSLFAAGGGLLMQSSLEHNLDAFIGATAGSTWGITDVMVVSAAVMALLALSCLALCALAWIPSSWVRRRSLVVVAFCASLALGLFTLVVVAIWVVIGQSLREDTAERIQRCLTMSPNLLQRCLKSWADQTAGTLLADRIEAGIHLLPWVVFGFVLMAALFLLVLFGNWLRRNSVDRPRIRYIVNRWVVGAGVTVNASYGILFLFLAWSFMFGGVDLPKWAQADALKPIALAMTVAVVGLVAATRSQFLTALDLVLDVIAHFRTEGEGLFGRSGKHVVWSRIVARFRAVIEEETETHPGNVVVVSHSQGTTVAAHALGALTVADVRVQTAADAGKRIWLVTMGSPIEHLYQYYMPRRYRVHAAAVAGWKHMYRIDDFIGTKIRRLGGDGGFNIGQGGHADYWSDPRAVGHIEKSIHEARRHMDYATPSLTDITLKG